MPNNDSVIKELLSLEEVKDWGERFLMPMIAMLSDLRLDVREGAFFAPLSEENIILNLSDFTENARKKLFFFEQAFLDYLKVGRIQCIYLGKYRHDGVIDSSHYHGGERSLYENTYERVLSLSDSLKAFAKKLLEERVKKENFDEIWLKINSEIKDVRSLFLLAVLRKALEDNLSMGYFARYSLQKGFPQDDLAKIAIQRFLKSLGEVPSDLSNHIHTNIDVTTWHSLVPKSSLIVHGQGHSFNSSSCKLIEYFIMHRSLVKFLMSKISEIDMEETLRNSFESMEPKAKSVLKQLLFLKLMKQKIDREPLELPKVAPLYGNVVKKMREEGFVQVLPNKQIVLSFGLDQDYLSRRISSLERERKNIIGNWLSMEIALKKKLEFAKKEPTRRRLILQQYVEINQHNLARSITKKCLRTFRGNVFGILDYIDETTFEFLDYIPKSCSIRLIVSRIQGSRTQAQKKAAKLGRSVKQLEIKAIDLFAVDEKFGGKMHHRWLACDGDAILEGELCNGLMVDFGQDLKSSSIANVQHRIQAVTNPYDDQKEFEEYWKRTEDDWKAITGKPIISKIFYSKAT